jgi:hypothetical protein
MSNTPDIQSRAGSEPHIPVTNFRLWYMGPCRSIEPVLTERLPLCADLTHKPSSAPKRIQRMVVLAQGPVSLPSTQLYPNQIHYIQPTSAHLFPAFKWRYWAEGTHWQQRSYRRSVANRYFSKTTYCCTVGKPTADQVVQAYDCVSLTPSRNPSESGSCSASRRSFPCFVQPDGSLP